MPRGKQPRGEKSAAIRELFEQNPNISASDVVSTLARRGIKVHGNLVYTIRSQMKSGRKGRRTQTIHSSNNGAINPVQLVRGVKALAVQAGGMKRLKELIEVLAE